MALQSSTTSSGIILSAKIIRAGTIKAEVYNQLQVREEVLRASASGYLLAGVDITILNSCFRALPTDLRLLGMDLSTFLFGFPPLNRNYFLPHSILSHSMSFPS